MEMIHEREAAQLLGLSMKTLAVWRHRQTGVPYYRVGTRICYDRVELVDWLKAQRQVPAKASA